jgi:hypothetical protein
LAVPEVLVCGFCPQGSEKRLGQMTELAAEVLESLSTPDQVDRRPVAERLGALQQRLAKYPSIASGEEFAGYP